MGFFTTSDGTRLHYEAEGGGERTLLFVHGFTDSGETFRSVSKGLWQTHRVVVYDHRAHGQSAAPESGYTMTRLAMDLKELIDGLGLAPVIPVGYSMGVHVLYRYIELYGTGDFEKVVLSVMSPKLMNSGDYRLGLRVNTGPQMVLDALLVANRSMEEYCLLSLRPEMSEAQKEAVRENARRVAAAHPHGPMVRLLLAMFEHDFWPMLGSIDVPALVIAGINDIYPMETHQAVSERIPDAKLVLVEGCGHLMLLERPDVYLEELVKFIG